MAFTWPIFTKINVLDKFYKELLFRVPLAKEEVVVGIVNDRLTKTGRRFEVDINVGKIKVKVKVTLVQALRLCTGRTAHRGSRGIALLFYDHGTRRG